MNSRALVGVIVLGLPVACIAQGSTSPSAAGSSDTAPAALQPAYATQSQPDKIIPGRLRLQKKPKYPKQAGAWVQGYVTLRVTIDETGGVESASVIGGDSLLGDCALEAVRKWEFEPFTKQGHAVRVQQDLTFNFVRGKKTAELELPLPEPKPLGVPGESHPPIRIPLWRAEAVAGSTSPRGPSLTVESSRRVTVPQPVYSPGPEYSDEARKAKYQGVCVLSVIVGRDGLPKDIRVARSLGMGLDEKAVEAVRRWKFTPAMKDGKPVAVAINVEVNFRL
jgi:TonB family protein